jgi:hypothetical protein
MAVTCASVNRGVGLKLDARRVRIRAVPLDQLCALFRLFLGRGFLGTDALPSNP